MTAFPWRYTNSGIWGLFFFLGRGKLRPFSAWEWVYEHTIAPERPGWGGGDVISEFWNHSVYILSSLALGCWWSSYIIRQCLTNLHYRAMVTGLWEINSFSGTRWGGMSVTLKQEGWGGSPALVQREQEQETARENKREKPECSAHPLTHNITDRHPCLYLWLKVSAAFMKNKTFISSASQRNQDRSLCKRGRFLASLTDVFMVSS